MLPINQKVSSVVIKYDPTAKKDSLTNNFDVGKVISGGVPLGNGYFKIKFSSYCMIIFPNVFSEIIFF